MSDFVVLIKRDTTVDEIKEVFRSAARQPFYQGILAVTEEELVSSDFKEIHTVQLSISTLQMS